MSARSSTMRRNEKSLRRALLVVAALAASTLLAASFLVSNSALHAQTAQSGSSNKPQTNAGSPDKPRSAKPASTASSSTADAATTPDSNTQASATSAMSQKPQEKGAGMVWVNTAAGVYHKPGTRWYGKTKKGKYMLEADAIKAGYKAAK
jgi:cytoskeletal protein RodZ